VSAARPARAAAAPAAAPVAPLVAPPPAVQRANSLADLTATEYLARYWRGEVSALDYARAAADRVEQFDPAIRAFHRFDRARLEERARRIDTVWRAEGRRGLMPGVPVGVKDVFNTYDFPTGMGSPILDRYTPGNDARVVSNIRLEGGLVPGKTATAEFAVHHPGPTVNPWDPRRSPGTSSSGSAAAVAARMVPLGLGTQTAGSTIRPASYCGVIGWKPSFGLLPRTAMLKTTDTLDTVGLLARSVDDAALLFEVCRVRGPNYPVSDAALADPARQTVRGRPWRIGLLEGPKRAFEAAAPRAGLDALARKLEAAGMVVEPYRLPPAFDRAHDIHERVYRKALAYYFKREWAERPDMFSPTLAAMIAGGMTIPPEEYQAGLAAQNEMARLFDADLQRLDAVLCLATADDAPLGLDGQDLPDHCLIFTLCGAPAMTLPLLTGSNGLPVGAQIATRKYADYKLLALARRLVEIAG
jgi:Asp-tRNA(Asn)/Glu-tRNA(Gln) amidotransferase A subunit family amidase